MNLLYKIKNEIGINKLNNVMAVIGMPDTKKTFFSLFFNYIEPLIYISFGYKTLGAKKDFLKSYNLDVFEVVLEKVTDPISKVIEVIREVERGTIVLDDFSLLLPIQQSVLANVILARPKDVKFNMVAQVYAARLTNGVFSKACIGLPTILLPLDRRLIDFLFVEKDNLKMLGRSEVKWSLGKKGTSA